MPKNVENPFQPDPPTAIGLVGGVASGKSTVARLFAERGLVHIDADAAAREATETHVILAAIRARFGNEVFADDGTLNRPALAGTVFSDPIALRDLEAITHPAIRSALEARIATALAAGKSVVLDIPLLLEGGWLDRCDACVFVEADHATRVARAEARGWEPGELDRREAAQTDLGVKSRACGYTVDTTGSLTETRAQIEAILARLAEPQTPSA